MPPTSAHTDHIIFFCRLSMLSAPVINYSAAPGAASSTSRYYLLSFDTIRYFDSSYHYIRFSDISAHTSRYAFIHRASERLGAASQRAEDSPSNHFADISRASPAYHYTHAPHYRRSRLRTPHLPPLRAEAEYAGEPAMKIGRPARQSHTPRERDLHFDIAVIRQATMRAMRASSAGRRYIHAHYAPNSRHRAAPLRPVVVVCVRLARAALRPGWPAPNTAGLVSLA